MFFWSGLLSAVHCERKQFLFFIKVHIHANLGVKCVQETSFVQTSLEEKLSLKFNVFIMTRNKMKAH